MLAQTLVVATLVTACVVYAAWALMPVAWRRFVAKRLTRHPMLMRFAPLRRAATAGPGGSCSCDGCDKAAQPTGDAVVRFVPRRSR
jgi:hypothetical protein